MGLNVFFLFFVGDSGAGAVVGMVIGYGGTGTFPDTPPSMAMYVSLLDVSDA